MQDITSEAMDTLMRHAPVWAASMAGRTKVFISDETPTAHVTGNNGRFKIVINPKLVHDMPFVLMHEVAHIFRKDITSMEKNKHLAREINVAADCIINDSLIGMGITASTSTREMACWGMDIYKKDCSNRSINDLMKIKPPEEKLSEAVEKASEPSSATPEGETYVEEFESEDASEKKSEVKGVGDDFSGYIGVGGGQVHTDAKTVARSVVSYARRMFFEAGFKSKNMSTKYDWRRNRSAFASRQDVVIPRTTVGEYGHNSEGPLVNLVLDTSGSMNESWVATAAMIAKEISTAGLDYDLWLTPSRRKAKRPDKVLAGLIEGTSVNHLLHEASNTRKLFQDRVGPTPSRAIYLREPLGHGANELREIAWFNTEDPVVWIYIGDYCSSVEFELFTDKNFLHVPMIPVGERNGNSWTRGTFQNFEEMSLPRWFFEV